MLYAALRGERAMQLTFTQFNLENLFSRYALLDNPVDQRSVQVHPIGITNIDYQGRPLSEATTQAQRNNTARAILDCKTDILAVQEVENLWTLRCFNDEYLGGYFGPMVLIEGNDGRGIDVALCIRQGCDARITGIRSHMDDVRKGAEAGARVERYYNSARNEITVSHNLFSRDCLEVDLDAQGKSLTLLVNHFKAQSSGKADDDLRTEQAARVAELAREVKTQKRLPIVIGDLNEDWRQPSKTSLKPLKALVDGGTLVDPFAKDADPWTHFYSPTQETSRLDYILVDGSLAPAIVASSILRSGITLRCTKAGERYPTMGVVGTEASDHCPASVTLDLGRVR